MNADLHNLDDLPVPSWEDDRDYRPPYGYQEWLYDESGDPDELALERADAELDQINHWIDVAEQNDQPDPS